MKDFIKPDNIEPSPRFMEKQRYFLLKRLNKFLPKSKFIYKQFWISGNRLYGVTYGGW